MCWRQPQSGAPSIVGWIQDEELRDRIDDAKLAGEGAMIAEMRSLIEAKPRLERVGLAPRAQVARALQRQA